MTKQIVDQLQRVIHLKNRPNRIISLVPSQTEMLCDLGLKDSVVGITKFCVHPRAFKESVTVVGGTKQIHLEKIVSLNPDIIYCFGWSHILPKNILGIHKTWNIDNIIIISIIICFISHICLAHI